MLISCSIFSNQISIGVKDYAHLDQDLGFLRRLGSSYQSVPEAIGKILRLWRQGSFDSVGALARFLRAGVRASRADCKVGVYSDGILHLSDHEFFQCSQKDAAETDQEAAALVVGRIEEARRTFCANYEVMANGVTSEFRQVIKELEGILHDLGGAQRAKAYKLFKKYLRRCFYRSTRLNPSDMRRDGWLFEHSDWKMPSVVLASMRIQIFGELLEFKPKFADQDHESYNFCILFAKSAEFEGVLVLSPL